MKVCLLGPRLMKVKKEKTNRSSQFLEDLSKFETSEYLNPSTTRHNKSKKKRKLNKSNNIFTDSSQLFKTLSPSIRKNLSSKFQSKPEISTKSQSKINFLKEKLRKTQEKIRKKHSKKGLEVKHPLPWGADQRIFKQKRTSDNEESRSRVKTDRDTSRKALRKEIGLDLFPNIKLKTKSVNKSEEKRKSKRSPDPAVQSYMKKKKKNERLMKLRLKLEENLKEKERIKALAKLEKTQNKKVKKKKRKRTKSILVNDEEKSTDPTTSVINKKENNDEVTPNTEPKKNALKESPLIGLPIKEVVTIQRWFRTIQPKLKSLKRNSEDLFENSSRKVSNGVLSSIKPSHPEALGAKESENNLSKVPKKVEKVPMLCLTSILQSRNSSFEESEKRKQFVGFDPRNTEEFEELYEQFQNFNIDSFNSLSPEEKEDSRHETPALESESSSAVKKKIEDMSLNSFELQKSSKIDSESSDLSEAENSLKKILENHEKNQEPVIEIYERPGIVMIDPSDSSEEEWNANNIIIHTDTNISEQTLDYKQKYFFSDYDSELQNLIIDEISSFLMSVNFVIRDKEVDTSQEFMNKFLVEVFELIEKDEKWFLAEINSPVLFDPLVKLKILQNSSVGELRKTLYFKGLIPPSTKLQMVKTYSTPKSQQIYIQMLVEALNEALNSFLPFSPSGFPDPWSTKSSIFQPYSQTTLIFLQALKTLSNWQSIKNGLLHSDDKLREERLNLILSHFIRDCEPAWLDYEDEESQLQLDISDLVLAELVTEIFILLH